MQAGMGVGALDATVVVDAKQQRKAVAAVAYYEREVAAAVESVERLRGKGDKLRALADEADAALEAAEVEVEAARQRYEDAKAQVA